jgi:hypothetical protein
MHDAARNVPERPLNDASFGQRVPDRCVPTVLHTGGGLSQKLLAESWVSPGVLCPKGRIVQGTERPRASIRRHVGRGRIGNAPVARNGIILPPRSATKNLMH